MTRKEAVDLVLLAVLGGKLSDDANVQRAEVEAYMNVAYAGAIKAVVVDGQALQSSPKTGSAQLGSALNNLYKPHVGTPEKDDDRNMWKLVLPGVLPLPGSSGVSIVYPQKNPNLPYMRFDNAIAAAGAAHITSVMPAFHVEEATIWFHAYPLPVHPVVAMCCPSIDTFGADEELPFPKEVDGVALKLATDWFRDQRQTMADNISDDKDLNEQ